MPFEERQYQTDAINANLAVYDAGIRRMMNVMATGTGKTRVVGQIKDKFQSRLPGQMLVLAHTEELVQQNLTKLREDNPTLKVEKEMAGEYADTGADIFSASVATLGRAGTKRVERFNWERIDKVVIDEAHHSTGEAYQRVLDVAGSLAPSTDKLLLGVTATSQRPDGRALSDIYEKVAFVYTLRQAISDGWLVPIRGLRITTDTSLADVTIHAGDYSKSDLSLTVNTAARNKRIVSEWIKYGENRKTVVFTVDIDHAQRMADAFKEAGIAAEALWGDDPDRADKIARHKSGQTLVLCNCNVLVEGYDDPSIACVVLSRPTTSALLFAQMVGRGTRLFEGKKDLLVLDVVDATVKNSLITLPTLMGLSNELDLRGQSLLDIVEKIEELQIDNPTIDFSKMLSIDELATIVQTVNLFEVRFPKEVEENSDLIWYRAIEGGYKIQIPKDGPEKAGYLRMHENELGQWDIEGRIKDVTLKAIRPTMEEAFKASDEQIRKRLGKMRLSYLLREATWHGKPVTSGQKKMLERLFPWRKFEYHLMNSGQASKMISERLGKKV